MSRFREAVTAALLPAPPSLRRIPRRGAALTTALVRIPERLLPPTAAADKLEIATVTSRMSTVGTAEMEEQRRRRPGVEEIVERVMEMLGSTEGGPVRWFSPVECGPPGRNSPTLLYLPGIDGTGLGLIRQHKRLGEIFKVWCLHIPAHDQTTFEGLVQYVEKTIRSEASFSPRSPIYLVGESIGACLALAVAARNPEMDFVLILANPATSFGKSQLQALLFLLDVVPKPLSDTDSYLLDIIAGNMNIAGTKSLIVESWHLLPETVKASLENFAEFWPYLSFVSAGLSVQSILWRLRMLESASSLVNRRLSGVKSQVLLLASGRDHLFPSGQEAERLLKEFPNSRIRHFKDSGHAIFLERGFDLVTTIKGVGYYRRSKHVDYVSDFLLPSPSESQKQIEGARWVELATSPVMLSTLEDGSIVKGLAGIPSKGPVVLVGNHMMLGLELGPIVSRFLTGRNILLRGIAHPFMFERVSELLMPDSSSFDYTRIMGAVPVSAKYFHKLLSMDSFILLYPGGAREALHKKGEQYKLFWPERPEFVRMASKFGASIVPFGVVGEDDICDVILDYDDLVKIPFYDILDKRINQNVVTLRADSSGQVGKQDLYLPGLLPKIPGRFYILFGKPIDTRVRREELLGDKERAQQLYMQIKRQVKNCISYLLKKREGDPYRNILPRLIYQSIHGYNAEVPTFEIGGTYEK